MIEQNRAEQILKAFPNNKILVVGDLMLDQFTWGKVRRISPEAPVPVIEVAEETYRIGGSGNAAVNIRTLDGTPITIGVIGQDDGAERLLSLFAELEIDSDNLLRDERRTTLKTRLIAHNQQVVRMDREDITPLSRKVKNILTERCVESLSKVQAVVISDYDKGVINPELLKSILTEAHRKKVPVFIDPKVQHAEYYRQATLLTPNQQEAELLSGVSITNRSSLERAGTRLLERFDCPYVLVTQGEDGMSLFSHNTVKHLRTTAREVFDVTGAGDTVIACLSMAVAAGAEMDEAALIANYAAGLVVGKVGTANVTRQELTASLDDINAHTPS